MTRRDNVDWAARKIAALRSLFKETSSALALPYEARPDVKTIRQDARLRNAHLVSLRLVADGVHRIGGT